MSDTPRTLQEECYGTCWAACERIEDRVVGLRPTTAACAIACGASHKALRCGDRLAGRKAGFQ